MTLKQNIKNMNIRWLFMLSTATLLFSASLLTSCESDYETNADDPAIPLSHEQQQLKAPGRGHYMLKALSGEMVEVMANLVAIGGFESLTITKKVNLEVDPSFGNNGVLTIDAGSVQDEYVFQYQPLQTDIDQLVGFTFHAERSNGASVTSDLQLVVTLSPRDNLPRRKWLWKSKIWVDADNTQDIKECEKDNYYLFNDDGTMSLNFGANTGTPGCDFDGFNVYDTWTLSEDEKTFTMVYHSIFSPDSPQTEVYRVKTLTTEKLELEIDYDLSAFGLGTEETFLYEFTAVPK
jgi:hypothetical protein